MDSAVELGQLIKGSKCLKALNLNDCNMNEKMNEAILSSLDQMQDSLLIEKLGYKYNELYSDQAIRLLEIMTKGGRNLIRLEISGNDFDDEIRDTYLHTFKAKGLGRLVLSKFESDDEDDEYEEQEEKLNKNIVYEELFI